jgi:3-isopropylmalate dehydratase small subunit
MSSVLKGCARLLGDEINTDVHCSSKYLPGRDNAYIAQRAFEQVAPGFAARLKPGDVIVAGRNFGINSSREQAVHIMRMMGAAAVIAPSFGRQFFRNGINNGLPLIECDIAGIAEGDELEIDLGAGRVAVAARGIARNAPQLPREIQAIPVAGGLIAFLQKHQQWELT